MSSYSDSSSYEDGPFNYGPPVPFGPASLGPVPLGPVSLGPPGIPIPVVEDPRSRYTFREVLVNNGFPYDGRDYVTQHRNNLILDGYFDHDLYSDDSDQDHFDHCPYRQGLVGHCDHRAHKVQVTSGIPYQDGTKTYLGPSPGGCNHCQSEKTYTNVGPKPKPKPSSKLGTNHKPQDKTAPMQVKSKPVPVPLNILKRASFSRPYRH